uniref:RRM domain-containing protein n=1 Tax=Polytomella parva TaxID=51329 RepID=A0A7S0UWD7_9CHLO|mmetsp:Transcript_18542/g.33718  ORF Transcript_18542/g.33718 Transcript_18542/m.33718 type:complete len:257 (+) Transcript_18542:72-842(+)|eukprot:CAMPEP_0175041860 /NCGR_PEP_ID=MMETSP0052_2-20121109/2185_1 /TAXON_ID=51329 ORGANISM="Polytomella parva, Strain SAG 63-3" /NCGR_SAMPLE_ID=MMETSP0052_2 /ASSEMBLY_ACC=CAM_ASM_000194 /LENGTH=256 /DNA_ID=CAMNT_0016304493 /DNA_START=53 /DNA_END=823 /DNA_ORIENTATION=-
MSSRNSHRKISLAVRNLRDDVTADDLRLKFEKYGAIRDVYIPVDYYTRKPHGYGFVEFLNTKDAEDAIRNLNGCVIKGKEISVDFSKESRKTPREMQTREDGRRGPVSRRDRDYDRGYDRRDRDYDRRDRDYSRRDRDCDRRDRDYDREYSRRDQDYDRGYDRRDRSRSRSRSRDYERGRDSRRSDRDNYDRDRNDRDRNDCDRDAYRSKSRSASPPGNAHEEPEHKESERARSVSKSPCRSASPAPRSSIDGTSA